jgi:hypothetical protein
MMTSRRHLLFTAAAAATLGVTAADEAFGASPYTPWLDKRMTAHLQRVLELNDDDWAAVAPRLDPVLHLLYERTAFGRPKLPRPPRPGETPDPSTGGNIVAVRNDRSRQADPGTPTAQMSEHYFQLIAIATESTPPAAEIKQALNDYRLARAKADAELAQARASLRELMDLKQEAVLVVMGILD